MCIVPWFVTRQTDFSSTHSIGALAVVGLGIGTAYFYNVLDIRGSRWRREMDQYLGTPIRAALISLAPADLNLTDEERDRLLQSEIYKELNGVFWEAVERSAVLTAQKPHFYSNGFGYSTALDVYLLLRFFGVLYGLFAVLLNEPWLFVIGLCLTAFSMLTKWLGFSHARRRHLALSQQQLETIRREQRDFVAGQFRTIVEGWRNAGSISNPTNEMAGKKKSLTVPAWAFIAMLMIFGVFGAMHSHWLRIPAQNTSTQSIGSAYIGTGRHKKAVAVVFVHGIFGTTEDTWLNPNSGSTFPGLLANDPDLQNKVDAFAFEYFTPKFNAAPPIVDLADQLRGELADHHLFEDHQKVVFIAHSMGGIVVREFLLNNREKISSVPMIFFYATPTNGADIAALAKIASANPQLRGMVPIESNDLLQSIQSSWLNSDQARSIPSYCGVEDLPTMGVMVVTRSSSTSLCNRPLDPFSASHIDIVKPVDREDSRYTRFVSALHKEVLDSVEITSPTSPTAEIAAYTPGKQLSVILSNQRRLVLSVGELDQTKADFLVRFTDEHGVNRDAVNEVAIRRIVGASFDSDLRAGIANLGGDLSRGGSFTVATKSDVPGQSVCNTFGPTFRGEAALAAARLGNAYDFCFGLSTMSSALSVAFPAYSAAWSNYPLDLCAPVVLDRMLFGLEHPGNVMLVTIVVRPGDFSTYSQVLAKRLKLQL
jgi:O-acetyl-ADP-ribose deacetylase (regulator of RNase III)